MTLTIEEARLALVRDHVANRHATRSVKGCPVCEHREKGGTPGDR